MNWSQPEITWAPLIPILVVLFAAAAGVLVESFVRTPAVRRLAQVSLSLGALVVSLGAAIVLWATQEGSGTLVLRLMLVVDRQSLAWQIMLAGFGILAVLLFERPRHPYTAGLFLSLPRLEAEGKKLRPIEGSVPDPLHPPRGCRFHPRCPFAFERCRTEPPPLVERAPGGAPSHQSACFYVDEHPEADLVAETLSRETPGDEVKEATA